jgi:hypothetical protein
MQELREKEVEQSLAFLPADLVRLLLGYAVERWPASWERGILVDVFIDDTWHTGVCCRFKGEKVLIHINGKLPQWCDMDQIAPPGSQYCLKDIGSATRRKCYFYRRHMAYRGLLSF